MRGWPLPHADNALDKEDRGQELVIGGSREISGAEILAANAAGRDLARWSRAVVALKGATTFILSPQGGEWRHVSSTPGLGTSGSGDVLAGILTGLAARGASLEQAAAWGKVLHALAGARLAERKGRLGFLARDLLVEIPLVMHWV